MLVDVVVVDLDYYIALHLITHNQYNNNQSGMLNIGNGLKFGSIEQDNQEKKKVQKNVVFIFILIYEQNSGECEMNIHKFAIFFIK